MLGQKLRRSLGARIALRLRPRLDLAYELAQLVEQDIGSACARSSASIRSSRREHRACLLHAERRYRGEMCQLARSCATRSREPSSAASSSRRSCAPVAVQEHGDEQPADEIRASARAKPRRGRSRSCRGLAEERGGAHRRRPMFRRRCRARSRAHGGAARRGTDRPGRATSSQRSSASPRLRVVVGERELRPQLHRNRCAERVEPRRLTRRRGRGDRQDRADAVRTPVEPLEEHGAGGDGRGGREAKRSHGVGELAGRVRRSPSRSSERSSSSTQRRSGSRPKLRGSRPAASGHIAAARRSRRRARGCRRRARSRAARDADQRRDGAVRVAVAEERILELLVRAVERAVVPVEAAAAFRGADEQRHEDAAVERARLVGRVALVCAREDSRGGLALQIVDCLAHVVAREEAVGMRLDEAAHERAVLVSVGRPYAPCSSNANGRSAPWKTRTRRGRTGAACRRDAANASAYSLRLRLRLLLVWHPGHQ